MKTALRIIITLVIVVAANFFVFWISFLLVPGTVKTSIILNIISKLIAIGIGVWVWKKTKGLQTGNSQQGRASYILLGGILVGATGFILGFLGPLIFSSSNNLGPMVGIFITGPIGFIVGLIAGGIYWEEQRKSSQPN